ncbi:hypothetical protein [Haloechinothrix salitolerans]|uniref:Uncharacterized protein n=1 Tax=Haloechinothrix salitolerans TaxID=926830 RepID=A0ABW2C825_9PSEU
MTKQKRPHNPYLSLIGAIGAFFLAVGVIGTVVNAASGGHLTMSPALWIGLIFGTLWLMISAIVYPLADLVKDQAHETSRTRSP